MIRPPPSNTVVQSGGLQHRTDQVALRPVPGMKTVSSQAERADDPTRCRATGAVRITASDSTGQPGTRGTAYAGHVQPFLGDAQLPLQTHPAANAPRAPRDPVSTAATMRAADHSIMPAAKSSDRWYILADAQRIEAPNTIEPDGRADVGENGDDCCGRTTAAMAAPAMPASKNGEAQRPWRSRSSWRRRRRGRPRQSGCRRGCR